MRLQISFAVCAIALSTSGAGAQNRTLRGTVRSGDRVLPSAEVGVVDGFVRALTNDSGRYTLTSLTSGRLHVFARAVGFLPAYAVVAGTDTAGVVDFVLTPSAVELPELKVESRFAKPARLAHTSKYDEFYRRRRTGAGTFLTRDEIEKATAVRSFELLRGIAGVQVAWNPPGVPGTSVKFARCANFPPKISVWIDGQKQPFLVGGPQGTSGAAMPGARNSGPNRGTVEDVWRSWLELFDAVGPNDIEAMEVFRGVSQIPAEYLDDSCAAVVIWTRDGGRRGG
ncbi:MAG: carboxypeptidase regulatory-like domain-containing protein [Gemmatimonadetes bacterium]|nr:carboxypeptidase regulatory-like domain-containing protein [Gemmatimonadota bacterium]MCC7131460.1 carboxypeptidase regulatory-like domain-containing protein [Gemmatimonadales bacterium]